MKSCTWVKKKLNPENIGIPWEASDYKIRCLISLAPSSHTFGQLYCRFLQEYLKIGPKYTKNTTNLQYNLWYWKWPPCWQYWLNCLLYSFSFSYLPVQDHTANHEMSQIHEYLKIVLPPVLLCRKGLKKRNKPFLNFPFWSCQLYSRNDWKQS